MSTPHPSRRGAVSRFHGAAICLALLAGLVGCVPPGLRPPSTAEEPGLEAVGAVVRQEVADGRVPGAVVLVGRGERLLYRQAYGNRRVGATTEPMTVDTVFDVASLTKVVVTTTAILQLAERGELALDAPAARYWPAFGAQGKEAITVRQLVTHTSGLPASVDAAGMRSPDDLWQRVASVRPLGPAGTDVRYSDVNFLVLGKIVEQVSGETLPDYAARHIASVLGWSDSGFAGPAPNGRLAARTAPTRPEPDAADTVGRVHDPLARAAGGAAGNAGWFATADELADFARTLLAGGGRLLRPESVDLLFSLQSPPGTTPRTIGWKLEPPLARNRAALPAVGAVSHLGYTGTGLWLDRTTGLYVVVLSNRTHLRGGDAGPLRARVVAAVGDWAGPVPAQRLAAAYPEAADRIAPFVAPRVAAPIRTGIDVLEEDGFDALRGKRVALLTHRSGVDGRGRRTIDVLRTAPGVSVVALLSPEHGLESSQEGQVRDGVDALSGLPIHSLYGKARRPAPELLRGLDAVVVDVQDAGTRFYTYSTTLAYVMEEAAAAGVAVYVLDRPNPLNAQTVQGPILDVAQRGFTGYWPLPTRHGMTLGELARLFAGEARIPVSLHVVAMRGYRRSQWYDDSGLPWLAPSPNLSSLTAATLYPGVGMIEGAPVSVGRGTTTPFELVGAPWIDGDRLSEAMNGIGLAGVRFAAVAFTPLTATHAGSRCRGIRVRLTDRDALDSPALGVALAHTLHRLYPAEFQLQRILGNLGSEDLLGRIRAGDPLPELLRDVDTRLAGFQETRRRYLVY